jgi:hypothetical protein
MLNRIIVLSFIFLALSACKKDDPKDDEPEPCGAGQGGEVTVKAYLKHNGVPISGQAAYMDTAYIMYNATSFPGPNTILYNFLVAGKYQEDFVRIEGLKCGQYYFYVAGYDTTLAQRVTGGMPVNIVQRSGELILDIPVND